MPQPLRTVGSLADVQDMTLISSCRDLNEAREAFKDALAKCVTHGEVIVLYRLARDWEAGFAHLSDLAANKLERV
jgi:imidazolonepropionase-like amidohydrolase